jgi:hypothetical protein
MFRLSVVVATRSRFFLVHTSDTLSAEGVPPAPTFRLLRGS